MIVLRRRMSAPMCGSSAMHSRAGGVGVLAANGTTVANAGIQQHLMPDKARLRPPGSTAPIAHPSAVLATGLPECICSAPSAILRTLRHGLVQKTDQIAASRDLSLVVRCR
jgi:hypothetical protein